MLPVVRDIPEGHLPLTCVVVDDGAPRVRNLQVTSRGIELLALSAEVLADIHAAWSDTLGADGLEILENDLEAITAGTALPSRLDLAGWLQGTGKDDSP